LPAKQRRFVDNADTTDASGPVQGLGRTVPFGLETVKRSFSDFSRRLAVRPPEFITRYRWPEDLRQDNAIIVEDLVSSHQPTLRICVQYAKIRPVVSGAAPFIETFPGYDAT
jgi:hypothetical protein